jgi:hypothetical protein
MKSSPGSLIDEARPALQIRSHTSAREEKRREEENPQIRSQTSSREQEKRRKEKKKRAEQHSHGLNTD